MKNHKIELAMCPYRTAIIEFVEKQYRHELLDSILISVLCGLFAFIFMNGILYQMETRHRTLLQWLGDSSVDDAPNLIWALNPLVLTGFIPFMLVGPAISRRKRYASFGRACEIGPLDAEVSFSRKRFITGLVFSIDSIEEPGKGYLPESAKFRRGITTNKTLIEAVESNVGKPAIFKLLFDRGPFTPLALLVNDRPKFFGIDQSDSKSQA